MIKRRFVAGSQYFGVRPLAISGRYAVVLGGIYFITGIIAFSGTIINYYFNFLPTWNVLPILFIAAFISTLVYLLQNHWRRRIMCHQCDRLQIYTLPWMLKARNVCNG
ncbi:MAG: hypothetical protein AAF653_18995, partial [Chloroflexota bacterium]